MKMTDGFLALMREYGATTTAMGRLGVELDRRNQSICDLIAERSQMTMAHQTAITNMKGEIEDLRLRHGQALDAQQVFNNTTIDKLKEEHADTIQVKDKEIDSLDDKDDQLVDLLGDLLRQRSTELQQLIDEKEQLEVELLKVRINNPIPRAEAAVLMLQIIDHCRGNKKIQAIKTYRQLTGCTLKEAKEVVEGFNQGWTLPKSQRP